MYFARLPDAERLKQLKEEFNFTCTNDCCLGDPAGTFSNKKNLNDKELAALPDTIGRYLCYFHQDTTRSDYYKIMRHLSKNYCTMRASEFLIAQKRA